MTDHDDSLETAARALREATDAPSADAAATRARLLDSHARSKAARPPLQWLAAAAVLVIFLGVPSAWALTTGRVTRWIEAIVGPAELEPPAPVETSAPPVTRRDRARRTAPSVPVAPSMDPVIDPTPIEPTPIEPTPIEPSIEPAPLEPAPVEPLPIERDHAEVLPSETSVERAAPREDTSERDDRLAYQAARAIELDAHDADAAVTAYDAYLASHPRGRFATEARYHRGVSLANAGRTDEAIRALTPLTHGGYREAEARELIEALEASEQP
jgi:hypothetical protein